MSLAHRIMRVFWAGTLLAACLAMPARADDREWFQKLDDIASLSNSSNEAALSQLGTLKAVLPRDTSYAVRKEVLLLQARILADAGRLEESYASNEDLLALARAKGDAAGIALAQLGEVDRLMDQNKAEAALARMQELQRGFAAVTDPQVQAQASLRLGRIYNALANYEQALAHFLTARKLADSLPRGADDVRLTALANSSRLYVNTKNPEKALAAIREALLIGEKTRGKTLANLYNTEGTALVALGRHKEGLASMQRALDMARDLGLDTLAAKVLGKMADVYLRTQDYVAAEGAAREALAVATRIKERNSQLMAKANIGFALGGQGKVAEARPYIDEVVGEFRKAASPRNLESMLDESSRMYEKNGLYKEALAITREQQQLRAKLFDADRAKALGALQESYDAKNRTRQIELLARENQLKEGELRNGRRQQTLTLFGIALASVAAGVIFWLYRRVRKANAALLHMNVQLEQLATRDPLTGLYNRRSFVERMRARVRKAQENRRSEYVGGVDLFTLIDVDHFKQVNDSMGHAAGDQVLVEIAERLKLAVRDSDMVLRWGGEEFLVYSHKAHPEQLEAMVKRMLDGIGGAPIQITGEAIPLTVSAGFISLPFSGIPETQLNWEKAIQLADLALYMAKGKGRNRAYGLMRLRVAPEEALPALEAGLEEAERKGLVELTLVSGPVREKDAMPMHPTKMW
jgi:diguanylate cyclase (GGDEF)-like protein